MRSRELRAEKHQLRQSIEGLLVPSGATFLVTYKGMKVLDFGALRKVLIGVGSECHVVPNRILRQAAKELGLQELADLKLTGETALVTGGTDPAKVAKTVRDFAKDKPVLGIKCGILDRKLIPAEQVKALADLPPREILLAQVLGTLLGPSRQFVTVLNAKVASIVYVLRAYADTKEKAA